MKAVFQQTFSSDKIIKVTTLTQGFVLKLVFFVGGVTKETQTTIITRYIVQIDLLKHKKSNYFSKSKLNKDCFFMVLLDSSCVMFLKDQLIFRFFFAA